MFVQYRIQLPELMSSLSLPMVAVELGTAEGLHARDLLENGVDMLYVVDKWEHIPNITGDGNFPQEWHDKNYQECMGRLNEEHSGLFTVLRGDTVEMAVNVPDNTLGMVYIDANHSYEGVKRDIEAWFPKLVSGGIMAMHDFLNEAYGVKEAVAKFCTANTLSYFIIPENSTEDAGAYFIKP